MRERLPSIDWLRGVVMVLMALDHVRFFFTNAHFPPEDMQRTWMALFLTRWVTHFCAPVFFFLAGTAAFLSAKKGLQLVIRGLVLIFLELTFIGFAWGFTFGYSFAGVIWALGWSMILLALLSRIPPVPLGILSLIVIATHDLVRGVDAGVFWRFLHTTGGVQIFGIDYNILYPLIPWCFVMSLGYACGPIWQWDAARRQRVLAISGAAATLLFLALRMTHAYGDPQDWNGSLISLLNTEKYPPSLQYLLMTLGPSLLALVLAEKWFARREPGIIGGALLTFGRVPMFYYICHLYLIHLLAVIINRRFDLAVVYAIWIAVVIALYVPCRWFELVKRRSNAVWLRYV